VLKKQRRKWCFFANNCTVLWNKWTYVQRTLED